MTRTVALAVALAGLVLGPAQASAGYYCSNNAEGDYNFQTPRSAWDESSRKAHWRKRGVEGRA